MLLWNAYSLIGQMTWNVGQLFKERMFVKNETSLEINDDNPENIQTSIIYYDIN